MAVKLGGKENPFLPAVFRRSGVCQSRIQFDITKQGRSTEPFILHPTKPGLSRLLTAREHARVKTIPEEVVAGVSETVAHEILGQSVIFTAFEALAAAVGRLLLRSIDVDGQIAA